MDYKPGPNRDVVKANCSACHSADYVQIQPRGEKFKRDFWQAEVTKIAKRMSRVALAALQWNKRAINNTFDTMGLRAALQYGVEACSLLDATGTPEYSTFDEIRRSKGLGEAMKWRDAQFAPFE